MTKGTPLSGKQINLDLRTSEQRGALVYHSGLALATAWLKRGKWPDDRIWLWGAESSGKTRLINSWCEQTGGSSVSLEDLATIIEAGKLEKLLKAKYCAVEDIPKAPNAKQQEILFHLLSTAQAVGCRVIISSRYKPTEITWTLADVKSRIMATCVVPIECEGQDERLPLLLSTLSSYQLKLSPILVSWLVRKLIWEPGIIFKAAKKLYEQSLITELPTNQRALQSFIMENHPELVTSAGRGTN